MLVTSLVLVGSFASAHAADPLCPDLSAGPRCADGQALDLEGQVLEDGLDVEVPLGFEFDVVSGDHRAVFTPRVVGDLLLTVAGEGTSLLSWPVAGPAGRLTSTLLPVDGSAVAELEVGFRYVVDVRVFKGSAEVDAFRLETALDDPRVESAPFSPFLRRGEVVDGIRLSSTAHTFSLPLAVASGAKDRVTLTSPPTISGHLVVDFDVADGVAGVVRQGSGDPPGGTVQLPAPADEVAVVPRWTVVADGRVGLVGSITTDITQVAVAGVGTFALSFPSSLPVTLFDGELTVVASQDARVHQLPQLAVPVATVDVGQVEVGDVASKVIPVENVGALPLVVQVQGPASERFTVAPTIVSVPPGAQEVLVVTYEPDAERREPDTLVLYTNDPAQPRVELGLAGEGVAPPEVCDPCPDTGEPADTGDRPGVDPQGGAPGCACGSTSAPAGWSVLVLGLLGWRRRRGGA
ncbi:MAG: hypothetical protein H6732_06535 [Alphaproteobacteria bacterium]|nr:hypothetical protein [Alphaproteobacteria bacterium]